MKSLLNADLFGQGINWDPSTTLAWLLIVVGVMVIVSFVVLSVLIVRTREPQDEEAKEERADEEPSPAAEQPEEEVAAAVPVPVSAELPLEEEALAESLRYDKSFTAKLIRSDEEVKEWYSELKNELLSYRKVHERMSWKKESYRLGRETVARLVFRGKTLCVLLPLDPGAVEPQYKVEDVSELAAAEDTPCLYRIKNDRRAKLAKELIARVMVRNGGEKTEREPQDYIPPYEGFVELLDRGLIKRKVTRGEGFIPATKEETAIASDEESGLSLDGE